MKHRSIATAIAILLVACLVLSGCGAEGLIRPKREQFVRTNLPVWDEPMELNIRLDMIPSDVLALYYETTVLAEGDKAQWQGAATAFFGGTYFKQECTSICDASGSAKLWREKWVQSDTRPPIPVIKKWLEDAGSRGYYSTRPVIPAEKAEVLEGCTDEAYTVKLFEDSLDWKAFCDFHPNSMFGGDSIFEQFKDIEVTLFFGTEDLMLDAILVTVGTPNGSWFSMAIRPESADAGPDVDVAGMTIGEGEISEEWNIVSSGTEDDE